MYSEGSRKMGRQASRFFLSFFRGIAPSVLNIPSNVWQEIQIPANWRNIPESWDPRFFIEVSYISLTLVTQIPTSQSQTDIECAKA